MGEFPVTSSRSIFTCATPWMVYKSLIPIPPYLAGPCTTTAGICQLYPIAVSACSRTGLKTSSHCVLVNAVAIRPNVIDGYNDVLTPNVMSSLDKKPFLMLLAHLCAFSFIRFVCSVSLPSGACHTPSVRLAVVAGSCSRYSLPPSNAGTWRRWASSGCAYRGIPLSHLK